jgi:hypothetical protein
VILVLDIILPVTRTEAHKLIYAEKNIPGFKYDYQLRESSVERQIQLHYYMQAFINELKAESWDQKLVNRIFAGTEKERIEQARLGFLKLFNYLDAQTAVYNFFNPNNKKDYSYTSDELSSAAIDMQFFGFASLILMNEMNKIPVYVVGPRTGKGSGKVYNANGDPTLRATRRPAFDVMATDGVEVEGQTFKMNEHAYNSLFKSGRKDIMPDDIIDALATQPQPAQPGSVQYVNPSTGTTVFVNPSTNEIVGIWPNSFGK